MPYPLNNVTVNQADYDSARLCQMQLPVSTAFVGVFNQAVYMSVERCEPGQRAGSGQFLADEYMFPGGYTLNRGYLIGSIRFKRAVATAGTTADPHAQVTAR